MSISFIMSLVSFCCSHPSMRISTRGIHRERCLHLCWIMITGSGGISFYFILICSFFQFIIVAISYFLHFQSLHFIFCNFLQSFIAEQLSSEPILSFSCSSFLHFWEKPADQVCHILVVSFAISWFGHSFNLSLWCEKNSTVVQRPGREGLPLGLVWQAGL